MNFRDTIEQMRAEVGEEEWAKIMASVRKMTEELKEEDMETVQSAKAEVIAKPTPDIEKLADKAVASKMTEEEIKKHIENNVIDEFND